MISDRRKIKAVTAKNIKSEDDIKDPVKHNYNSFASRFKTIKPTIKASFHCLVWKI